MKKGIHPEMHTVIYKDISTEHCFLSQSTVRAKETMKWEDGNEYPVIKVEISSDPTRSTPASTVPSPWKGASSAS